MRSRWVGLAGAVALLAAQAWAENDPPGTAVAHVGVIDAIPMGPSLEERLAEIRRRIQEALSYPSAARRRGVTGTARVQFQVGDDGRAEAVELVRSSGSPLLDRAARQSVVDAGVLPRVYGRLEVPVRFDLHHRWR
jgi:protein TonB